jgi:hypothetical protein
MPITLQPGDNTLNMQMVFITSSLSGIVTDAATGAPLANVTVIADNGIQSRGGTTNAQGLYQILGLTPGVYTVSFSLAGYDTLVV